MGAIGGTNWKCKNDTSEKSAKKFADFTAASPQNLGNPPNWKTGQDGQVIWTQPPWILGDFISFSGVLKKTIFWFSHLSHEKNPPTFHYTGY